MHLFVEVPVYRSSLSPTKSPTVAELYSIAASFSLSMQAKNCSLLHFLLFLCPVWHQALPFFHEDSVVAG